MVVPPEDVLVGDQLPVAGGDALLDRGVVARLEQERVVVLFATVQLDDAHGGGEPEPVDHRLDDLGHRRADLHVETDVGGPAGTSGVEPVVLEDLDTRLGGLVDDRRARAGVEARER